MRTANEVLNKWDWDSKSEIIEAMEIYAKEVAIDFAKWLNNNCIVSTGGQWRHHNKWIQVKKTNELFDLYQQEKSSLK